MAKRRHNVFVKHFAAMQLILMMQAADGSMPNVEYVKRRATPLRVARFPRAKKHEMLKYLLDFLPLVDPEVYKAFHTMLKRPRSVAGITLNLTEVEKGSKFNAAMLQRITDFAGLPMWADDPPHGCYLIMREVVSDLLA